MNADTPSEIEKAIQELLREPKYPAKAFVSSGATFAEVYAMAAGLRLAVADMAEGAAICLATDSKAVIAAALLASLAGGPSLLLPYAFSARVLAQMQQTTGFTVALTNGSNESSRRGGPVCPPSLNRDFPPGVQLIRPAQFDQCPNQRLKIPIQTGRQAAASILLHIFTGGSTGKPQLWAKTGKNILSEGFFLASRFGVTRDDCILATISPYHIYGLLFSVVLPLVSSATVVDDTPSFPGEIVRAAKEENITLLASVPPHYRVLRDVRLPGTLRLAFSSAGMLDAADNKEFCRTNNKGLVEVYGSTETGGIATRNRSLGEEYFTAFPAIDWKIVDSRLAVRSPYISPELPVDAEGFFIAGDKVEGRGPQCFSLQGRADTVTKVGGKRVDLEEIGQLIKKASGVIDCVVMALPESGAREHQIGVMIEGRAINLARIRKTLSDSLEPYALPRRIRTVDHIPVKNNGKYDWPAIIQLMNDE